MVTDPTKSVKHSASDTPLATNVQPVLDRLASIAPSQEQPILTVMLDWRPEGTNPGGTRPDDDTADLKRSQRRNPSQETQESGWRPVRVILDRELQRLIDEHGPRGDIFDNLTADAERIASYLDTELDPSAQGVVIVACSARSIFEAVPLALPVPTRVRLGPLPALSGLVQVKDDYPTFAVLLADQHDATLSFVTHATAHGSIELRGTDYPRRQKQGGWSQRRFQARAGERVDAFARDIADETRRALDDHGIDMLIVAGDEVITSPLDASFHQTVKDRVIATLRLDIRTSDSDLLDATIPVAEDAERQREEELVRRLRDSIGAGEYGAAGAAAVLEALQAGQVETLLLVDDFEGAGWADFGFSTHGVGEPPAVHPLGGNPSDIAAVDLRELLVLLASTSGADIDIIHSSVPVPDEEPESDRERASVQARTPAASAMDDIGGVGAILRFSMDDDEG